MQISLGPAQIGTVQPKQLGEIPHRQGHKEAQITFDLLQSHHWRIAWAFCHIEDGTYMWAYPLHLGHQLQQATRGWKECLNHLSHWWSLEATFLDMGSWPGNLVSQIVKGVFSPITANRVWFHMLEVRSHKILSQYLVTKLHFKLSPL